MVDNGVWAFAFCIQNDNTDILASVRGNIADYVMRCVQPVDDEGVVFPASFEKKLRDSRHSTLSACSWTTHKSNLLLSTVCQS